MSYHQNFLFAMLKDQYVLRKPFYHKSFVRVDFWNHDFAGRSPINSDLSVHTHRRFSLIFLMKLKGHTCRKLTEPDC